ncbi:MAG TPA: hypothetical protein VHY33_10015 [Thermoanaerobaculia bacterium]|jgi:hypothetical protein|nr:hypothetical protein [Thermoanaerobaculia bacterium]
MKKTLILLGFTLVAALPVFAQHNEIDLLFGGAKAMKTLAGGKSDFQHGFEEISYGVSMEQDTIFKIKVGRMNAKTAFASSTKDDKGNNIVVPGNVDPKGQIDYFDAVIEYRFSEPFGSTGLFAGTGLYRQSGSSTTGTHLSESDYGFVGGVNGLFPLTRNVGISAEAAYHWVHFYNPKPRYATIGVGVRFAF